MSASSSTTAFSDGSIQEWVQNPTPESARHLIRAYRESEWRSTRLEVVRGLGLFSDLRSFAFLVELLQKNEDLAEQMAAIDALSIRKSRSSQYFLRAFFNQASEALKSPVAYALGQTQDFQVIQQLLVEWDRAVKQDHALLLKHLVMALGELKAFESLPRIRELMVASVGIDPDLMTAGMFALAKLERDPAVVTRYESAFRGDPLRSQIYKSALAQIQIRSQFKLEDYLEKIFRHPSPHPVLPWELRAFAEDEVELGLSVFDGLEQPKRYLFALQGLKPKARGRALKKWLQSMIDGSQRSEGEWASLISDVSMLLDESVLNEVRDEIQALREPASLELQLKWLDALAPWTNIEAQGRGFLLDQEDAIAIRFLNLWSEWALVKPRDSKLIEEWVNTYELSPLVMGRLLRACAELGHPLQSFAKHWPKDFKEASLRSSILVYFEALPQELDLKEFINQILLLSQNEREQLGVRILGVMEAIAGHQKSGKIADSRFWDVLKWYSGSMNPELQVGVLKVLRQQAQPGFEAWTVEKLSVPHRLVELNAVIALKSFPGSREASEALVPKLESALQVVQGRALDTLCAHISLLARRAVMEYLQAHIEQEEVVDKVYRSFDPEKRGGKEFVDVLERLLQVNPDHPQWEKLVSLRDRLKPASDPLAPGGSGLSTENQAELDQMDRKLTAMIPKFKQLDSMTQAALRAAEQPFWEEETKQLPVDKAPTVLEYCKALDLILDRHLGQKWLFPKLDSQLHDFQTLWHRIGFGEDYPNLDRVLTATGLKGRIQPEQFPLHKAKMMCGTFFNGKILQDRFKVFDGLRAWAVIFLIFARKLPSGPQAALIQLGHEEKCVSIAKRLMTLQDLRNPAAHRQTYVDLTAVTAVRNESIALVNTVMDLLG